MSIIFTYLPFVISLSSGYLLLSLFFYKEKPPFLLHIFLGAGLGFGVSAALTFMSFIVFNKLLAPFVIALNLSVLVALACVCLFLTLKNFNLQKLNNKQFLFDLLQLLALLALSIPLWYQAHFYAYGGWDAWSTWNLKAKFMFLGGEHWQNLFDPLLWRSSPHYPLLLPLINVWGWSFLSEPLYKVPVFTSYCFTLMTVGLVFASLRRLIKTPYSFLAALVLMTSPSYLKIGFSQYCDIVLSFYLLASFVCLILAKTENKISYLVLAGLFIGLLGCTKPEGLIAAIIVTFLASFYLIFSKTLVDRKKALGSFWLSLVLASLPIIIFQIFYAPSNQTFINGLISKSHPVTYLRFKTIFAFFFLETLAPIFCTWYYFKNGVFDAAVMKWNGLWLFLLAGLLLSRGRCFNRRTIIIPLFLLVYVSIIIFYYFLNTYFKIDWWLQVTLHRILFSILPLFLFWVFYSLWQEHKT